MEGVIKRKVEDKGFGFIEVAGRQGDVFFHFSALKNVKFEDLRLGQQVSFEITDTQKGVRAEEIYTQN
jgi:cold shock protein